MKQIESSNQLSEIFKSLRHDKNFHLGLGDIRLTIDMQNIISDMFDKYTNADARKKFWEETARLSTEYRKEGQQEKAEGIIDCRILFNRLFS